MTDKQPIAFKAEIKQLLDILIHSLYTDREIFLRELISNASDALTQMHFVSLTEREVLDPDTELKIKITGDEDNKIIKVTDTGIGMTQDELRKNLGTIAQSGARAFLEATQDGENQQALVDVIGQFGVGFYSVFMVAEWVRVTSRSFQTDSEGAYWYATGGDTFEVGSCVKDRRGTEIEIKLNAESEDFLQELRLREIIKKHSDYVSYPIYLGDSDEPINSQLALWRQSLRDVEPDQYDDFYRQLTLDFEKPLDHIHYVVDAPLQLYALLYFPSKIDRGMFTLRKDDGLKLYVRKVLIQEYNNDLLPRHFRFIQGVVDTEDLPLNVSRETIQDNPIITKIRSVIANQVVNKLKSLAKDEVETYAKFWVNFGTFIKEGIASEPGESETLAPLIRFHTTTQNESWVSLSDYVQRMKAGQDKIYFILGDDDRSVARSPHLDYFRENGYEVVMFTDPMDSFMLMGLRQYESFDLVNVAAADLKLPDSVEKPESESKPEKIPDADLDLLIERFRSILGERVTDVRSTDRLRDSVARLVDPEGTMDQEMQRVYRYLEREYEVPKKVLELNPRHPILAKLSQLDDKDELNFEIIEQIYDSALLIEGLHPDPASMLPRIQELMEKALN
jgi:HSP90 family molecular chaperone